MRAIPVEHASLPGSFAVVILAFSACHANPMPAPATQLDAASVYDCAVSQMEQDGWRLDAERKGAQPEDRMAAFTRGSTNATLTVRRTQGGHVDVQVVNGLFGGNTTPYPAPLDEPKAHIQDRCMSGGH